MNYYKYNSNTNYYIILLLILILNNFCLKSFIEITDK